jgi:hypothetical protein
MRLLDRTKLYPARPVLFAKSARYYNRQRGNCILIHLSDPGVRTPARLDLSTLAIPR